MSNEVPENIALFYTEGSSDKEYRVELRLVEGGWMALGFNGRRGRTLTEQKKTPIPVDYATAKSVYDKTIKSKVKTGYTEDVTGAIYQSLPSDKQFSGFVPQLLNTIRDASTLSEFVKDDKYVIQEKHDGERRPIRYLGGVVSGMNKEGVFTSLPVNIVNDILSLQTSNSLLDGEIIGERYVVFDLLELDGKDLRGKPYKDRLSKLNKLFEGKSFDGMEIVHTASTPEEKRELMKNLKDHCAEGFAIKDISAKYAPSRPASGGSQMKYKFTETCSVQVVTKSKTKRSVGLQARVDDTENSEMIFVGNVTISSNFDIPNVGDIVNVEYLYKYENGSIFQPVFKGTRTDQSLPDDLSKFKLKQDEAFVASGINTKKLAL